MFVKFSPNEYVLKYRNGKIVDEGIGLSFFNFRSNTSACAIPVSTTDMDFIFDETTKDFQSVTVQGQLSCRIVDYKKAAAAFDFTVNLANGKYKDPPAPKITRRIINISHVIVKNHIGNTDLTLAIQSSGPIAEKVLEELQSDPECESLGIKVIGFSILQIKATADTSRALEAKTREDILKQSDDALYERRNASIDQERRVKENELNTEISVEEKKKHIKETELNTQRLMLEGKTELEKISTNSEIEKKHIELQAEIELERIRTSNEIEAQQIKLDAEIELERKRRELADLKLENAKKEADAQAYKIGEIMQAYNKLSADVLVALATINMEPEKIIAQAFNNLASNSEKIGTLNITPDLLESLKVR